MIFKFEIIFRQPVMFDCEGSMISFPCDPDRPSRGQRPTTNASSQVVTSQARTSVSPTASQKRNPESTPPQGPSQVRSPPYTGTGAAGSGAVSPSAGSSSAREAGPLDRVALSTPQLTSPPHNKSVGPLDCGMLSENIH